MIGLLVEKNVIYKMSDDFSISEKVLTKNENNEWIYCPDKEGTYKYEKVYVLKKGYNDIKYFINKDEADNFMEELKSKIAENKFIHVKDNEIEFI